MRVVVHDYSGHPFQVQLSRGLAQRGFTVAHQYCAAYVTGRGAVGRSPSDPDGFAVEPLCESECVDRYSPVRRLWHEVSYGVRAVSRIRRRQPDAALLSNIPLFALAIVSAGLRLASVPYVLWLQDLYSEALSVEFVHRLGRLGGLLGRLSRGIERRVALWADSVVAISPVFETTLEGWGVSATRQQVIPNWAPVDEVRPSEGGRRWAARHGLGGRPVVLYAGTLGLKHDVSLLADLAHGLAGSADVVVVSEGHGRQLLEQDAARRTLSNLHLLDFQPYAELPDMLGSADVVVALLEPDASRYSVPSKILTYLAAGRPVLAQLPADNAAARVLEEAGAGVVIPPADRQGLVRAARALLGDGPTRERLGREGRSYAEAAFALDPIVDRFAEVLGPPSPHGPGGRAGSRGPQPVPAV